MTKTALVALLDGPGTREDAQDIDLRIVGDLHRTRRMLPLMVTVGNLVATLPPGRPVLQAVPRSPPRSHSVGVLSTAHRPFKDPALYTDVKLLCDTRNAVTPPEGSRYLRA